MNDLLFEDAQEVEEGANPGELKKLMALVSQYLEVEGEIAAMEAALKARKADLRKFQEVTIPDAMDEAGTTAVTHAASGREVKLEQVIRAAIPSAKLPQALEWLRDNGQEGLISNQLTARFTKGQGNMAGEAEATLRELGAEPKMKVSVHPSTLSAFAREQLGLGVKLPFDLLGIYTGRVVKVK
jgi:hypothetical protein